ncbi:MAG TPA: glycoside hydrolase family 3 N-terminal domain-containing protein [Cytophagaceae bacterium]
MKKIKRLVFSLLILFSMNSFSQPEIEKKVDALLSQMTLEEKVGQMTQVTLDVICKGKPFDEKKKQELDKDMLKKVLVDYKVGSILNTGAYTLPREQWYEIISEIQKIALKQTRLKIPVIYGIDAIHGANYTVGATLFPQQLGLAATWNPEFAEQMGAITAYEVRASAIPWNFSPVLDLGRQPLWSRFFETFGEDPYLATLMGDATVKGYQGDNVGDPEKVAACLKHFVGYSNSRSGKDRTPIMMTERELREYYLVPFKSAIEKGAQTIMINSSEIDGVPVHADYHILTSILKEELKFDGFAVTDWEDIVMLHTVHNVADSEKEAVKLAINAGVDMSMVPLKLDFADHLIELVKEGQVPMERIDDAVRRILRVKYRLGLFEKVYYDMKRYPKFGSPEFAEASYKAALESVTLLKNNDRVLPMAKDKKVLVTGVAGNSMIYLNGAWTHTWQGQDPSYDTKGKKTIYQAISDIIGKDNTFYLQGTTEDKDVNTAEVVAKAKEADYIVVCLGELPSTEKVGDIEDLTFPQAQLNLVAELKKTNKPVIVVLVESRPRIFSSVESSMDAILMAYRPGDEGGRAIAATIFGLNNPSGKLPFTYPKHTGSLVLYDHKYSEKRDKNFAFNAFNPQFEFGTGLSYTTFAYSDLKLDKTRCSESESITVSVKVTNTGQLEGKEVVQLYTRDHYASITPSVKRLRRFTKINLKPGESKIVQFTLNKDDLSFLNRKLEWITEPGKFDIMIGDQKAEFEYYIKTTNN